MATGNAIDDYRLDGRIAVLTGAAGGLGGAMAERLAGCGAALVLIDIEAAALEPRRSALAANGVDVLALGCDLGDEQQIAAAAKATLDRFGRCDILVNNAAVMPRGVPLEDLDAATWDRLMAINVRAPFLCAKHFGTDMLTRRSGSIVNIASIAATLPNTTGPYGPSKAALLALTRQIAVEWGPRGVRCNAVSPGLVRTPMSEASYADPEIHAMRVGMVASRRIGRPADIAQVVTYLASDAAAYVNGQEIVVDGGFLHTSLVRIQPMAEQPKSS
jgi:NAD(P)-dependent dehydrogenase (short-subunit alcohol dehydrogenase family)